ncbi:hypothetical protein GW17_00039446 [Ensete ventricosum]|nr:hypothetical protein GW17_00039446 [Ensete ventricosum]
MSGLSWATSFGLRMDPLLSLSFLPPHERRFLEALRKREEGSFISVICMSARGCATSMGSGISAIIRDFGSTIVVLSSGGATLVDLGAVNALVAMRSFFNVDLVITTRRLKKVRKNYFIPLEYELHAPLPGEHPYDAFPNGFSLSTDALEAGLRFPLHLVIEACLERCQISHSQMAPNSWRNLVAFLWECFGSSVMMTRDLFLAYFCLGQGQASYYLTARAGFRVGGAPSSNKGWKSWFFFVLIVGVGASRPSGFLER